MPGTTTKREPRAGWRGLRGPGWRWELARARAGVPLRDADEREDAALREAHEYLGLVARGESGRAAARRRVPRVAAAEDLEAHAGLRERAMLLVLGNAPPGEIATAVGVEEAVVATWEALFFDVRAAREATGWIHAEVVEPARERGGDALAARLKAAVAGGPLIARAILEADARLPVSAAERLFDRRLHLQLKLDEAAAKPMGSPRDALRFVTRTHELRLEERKLDLEERRIEARSREAHLKRELAELRREAAAARRDEREAARERREAERRAEVERVLRERETARARAPFSPLADLVWGSESTPAHTEGTDDGRGRLRRVA